MTKQIEKVMKQLNQRLKADNSSFRFSVVTDSNKGCYRINKCEVRYSDFHGKERLVNIQNMFIHIEADEVIRMFMAMTTAIDVLI